MSKKTRKKSSKSASGRSAGKPGSAKAKSPLKTAGKATKATRKTAKKTTKAKTAAKTVRKTTAKTPASRTAAKKSSASKSSAAKPAIAKKLKAKPAAKPVGLVAALNEGDTAPAFSLPRDGGQLVSLASYAGRKLVIFFYPRADTPGCTLEAIAFSRLDGAFADAETAVLGVSADPVTAQESFRDKHDLTVPLVSDQQLGMLKAYGVWGEKSMYGKTFMGISRTTVLVDGDGRIARIWRNVKVDGHADEVLAAAQLA